jgi:hypothetical protein
MWRAPIASSRGSPPDARSAEAALGINVQPDSRNRFAAMTKLTQSLGQVQIRKSLAAYQQRVSRSVWIFGDDPR